MRGGRRLWVRAMEQTRTLRAWLVEEAKRLDIPPSEPIRRIVGAWRTEHETSVLVHPARGRA